MSRFTEILNDITIMYGLLLILVVLMYIAFYRRPRTSTVRGKPLPTKGTR